MSNLDFEFNSRFEEDESIIKERMLESDSLKDYRREPGDFVYDVVAPLAPEIQQHQANMDEILRQSFTLFAEGIYLEYKVAEVGLQKTMAQQAIGQLQVTASQGVIIPTGQKLTTIVLDNDNNPITATVEGGEVVFSSAGTLAVDIKTDGAGDIMNLAPGTSWIFSPPIAGVQKIEQLERLKGGTDEEDDEVLRARWAEKRQKPVRSGNKQNYVAWALEVTGVGKAKVIPLWDGRNTVKVIIADTEGQPAIDTLVEAVQDFIDPSQDGMGEGVAPIGAIVTVSSVRDLPVNITATVSLNPGSTLEEATAALRIDADAYLDQLGTQVMDSTVTSPVVIVYNKVAALLAMNNHIADYADLQVNSGTANITLEPDEIPTSGMLTLT